MGKISAVLRLTRIEHSLMLVFAVLAAELITKGLPSANYLALSFITPIFISMGSFAINDYFDVEVDKANKKKRPLVTGELSRSSALYLTFIFMAIGIIASALINVYCLVIAIIFAAFSLLYSYKIKELPLAGNSYIAFSMAIPFVFGNYVVSSGLGSSIILVSIMIFLSGIAREIHGTIRDYEGDVRMRKAKTLPGVIGKKNSAVFAFLLYIAAIFISFYLFVYIAPFRANYVYLTIIIISDLLLFYVSYSCLEVRNKKFYEKARNISLMSMALALIALILAPL